MNNYRAGWLLGTVGTVGTVGAVESVGTVGAVESVGAVDMVGAGVTTFGSVDILRKQTTFGNL